jgi:hypothetical protein
VAIRLSELHGRTNSNWTRHCPSIEGHEWPGNCGIPLHAAQFLDTVFGGNRKASRARAWGASVLLDPCVAIRRNIPSERFSRIHFEESSVAETTSSASIPDGMGIT